jgi:DNA topoisomerase IB
MGHSSRRSSSSILEQAETAVTAARQAGLRYVTAQTPGIRRMGSASRFRYLDAQGKRITDKTELARIASLAIPPAYRDVWICANPRGHLQATGVDARGRKQYRYHPDWRSARDGDKFGRMVAFGQALPRLRRRIKRDLSLPGLPRNKVLAVVVALLDATLIRIGNDAYARDNNSYGLTTVRDRHVRFLRDGRASFRFRGKGGVAHEVTLDDRRLTRIVRRCQQLPGQQLFQYVDDDGVRHGIDSDQVNDYLRAATGEDFTAKDFRTWVATVRALTLMGATPLPEPPSERAIKSCIVDAIRVVAGELRNTPVVCRKSYINPAVFEAWRDGSLQRTAGDELKHAPRKAEAATLRFMRNQARGRGARKRIG